uniref:MFS transporter n=1 Tax=Muribaculaceae bacterium Z82 TaxID=2304548 RepID=A0A7C9NSK5_9BACT
MGAPSSNPSSKKSIFPYLVVATGIVCCFGPCAFALSCAGIYFTPVSESLGVGRGTFALYLTIMLVVTALILPFLGKLTEQKDLRLVLSGGVLCIGVPLVCMSFFNAVWQFYVAGAIMGVGLAEMLVLTVPTLINRWFRKSVGFYIGLCMAFTGIGGAVFNLLGGYLIGMGPEGWRTGYLVFGVLCLVMALPFTLLCVRSHPEDLGLLPVGAKEAAAAGSTTAAAAKPVGIPAKKAMRTSAFFILAVFAGLANLGMNFYQYLPSYASSLVQFPDVVAIAATIASVAMLGQAIGKILIGVINDKVNVRAGLFFSMLCGLAGLAIMLCVPSMAWIMLCGGFLFGIFYASGTVLIPLMTRTIFGTLEYSSIYSRIAMVGSLCGAFAVTFWGVLVDSLGFAVTFGVVIAVIVLLIVLGVLSLNAAKKFAGEMQG